MNTNKQNYNYQSGSLLNTTNSPELQALSAMQDRNKAADVANLRARFGASGGSSMGSGAQYSEGNYLAAANPQNQLAMGSLMRSQQGMDLQQQGLNSQTRLGLLGAGAQDTLGRLGLSNQSQLGNRQIGSNESIANAGNETSASISNSQVGMQGKQALLNYMLGKGQLGLQGLQQDSGNALSQAGFNNGAMQTNNMNNYNQNQSRNQFDMNLFGQNSQNSLQNQQLMNQWGVQGAQLGQQGQLGGLNMMNNSFNQASQLGQAQATNVVSPSPFSQAVGALGAIGSLAGGIGQLGGQNGAGWWGGGQPSMGQGAGQGNGQSSMLPPNFQIPQFNPQQYSNPQMFQQNSNPQFGGGMNPGAMGGIPFGGQMMANFNPANFQMGGNMQTPPSYGYPAGNVQQFGMRP